MNEDDKLLTDDEMKEKLIALLMSQLPKGDARLVMIVDFSTKKSEENKVICSLGIMKENADKYAKASARYLRNLLSTIMKGFNGPSAAEMITEMILGLTEKKQEEIAKIIEEVTEK